MMSSAVWRRTKRNSDWFRRRRSGPVPRRKTQALLSIVTAMDRSTKIMLFEQVIDQLLIIPQPAITATKRVLR